MTEIKPPEIVELSIPYKLTPKGEEMARRGKSRMPRSEKTKLNKKCAYCGEIFFNKRGESPGVWNSRMFCSRSCTAKVNPVGKRLKEQECIYCKRSFVPKYRSSQKYCTYECSTHKKPWNRGINNPFNSGDKHPNWQGGKTKERDKARNTLTYKVWRRNVLERDNHTCVDCKSTASLHVHHIKGWSESKGDRYLVDNGETLCAKCHASRHPNLTKIILFQSEVSSGKN